MRRTRFAPRRRAARLPAGARWLMYVGGFGPHKHVDVIVQAHARSRSTACRQAADALVAHRDGSDCDVAGIRRVIKECGTETSGALGRLPAGRGSAAPAQRRGGARCWFRPLRVLDCPRWRRPAAARRSSPRPRARCRSFWTAGDVFVRRVTSRRSQRAIERSRRRTSQRAAHGRAALERAARAQLDAVPARVAPGRAGESGAARPKNGSAMQGLSSQAFNRPPDPDSGARSRPDSARLQRGARHRARRSRACDRCWRRSRSPARSSSSTTDRRMARAARDRGAACA